MSEHLITYEPQLLQSSAGKHSNQRYPQGERYCAIVGAESITPHRSISVMRFEDRDTASIESDDFQLSIKIRLDAWALRRLALQLLDAAHDIEQLPASSLIEVAA